MGSRRIGGWIGSRWQSVGLAGRCPRPASRFQGMAAAYVGSRRIGGWIGSRWLRVREPTRNRVEGATWNNPPGLKTRRRWCDGRRPPRWLGFGELEAGNGRRGSKGWSRRVVHAESVTGSGLGGFGFASRGRTGVEGAAWNNPTGSEDALPMVRRRPRPRWPGFGFAGSSSGTDVELPGLRAAYGSRRIGEWIRSSSPGADVELPGLRAAYGSRRIGEDRVSAAEGSQSEAEPEVEGSTWNNPLGGRRHRIRGVASSDPSTARVSG